MSVSPTTCVLVDDHPMVRRAVRLQLAGLPGLAIVGEAEDGVEGLELLRELRPDIAVVDVRMPRMDGIEMTRRVRELDLPTQVIVHSAFASPGVVAAARSAGAVACVHKSDAAVSLLDVLGGLT